MKEQTGWPQVSPVGAELYGVEVFLGRFVKEVETVKDGERVWWMCLLPGP